MNVERVMTKNVRTCGPDESLDTAARIMWEGDCGCVPVVEADDTGRVVGMLTDRDVCMAAYTCGKCLCDLSVKDAMAHVVVGCRPDDSIAAAESSMRKAQVRRLPVLDEDGHLLGLISLADIAREAARGRSSKKQKVSDAEVGQALSDICRPRAGEPAGDEMCTP